MKRLNIIKKFTAMVATMALVLASCSSDPEVESATVVVEDDTNLVLKSSDCSSSYLSSTTLSFKITGEDTFKALRSTAEGVAYAECFTIGVSDGADYNVDFTGSALRVEADGSLEIDVDKSVLSQSDYITLSYQKSEDNPLTTTSGCELETFVSLSVADTGTGDSSYDVVSWTLTEGSAEPVKGSKTSFYYLEGATLTEDANALTFTDTSMSGSGFEYHVSSNWYYSGETTTATSYVMSAEVISAMEVGVSTLHMQSIFKRPVYCFVDGVKQVSYPISDKSDANYGYYQMDIQFDFVVYPATIDASFALFTDATLRNEHDATRTKYESTDPYEVYVGNTYYLAGTTSDYDGAFELTEKWEFEENDTTFECDDDLEKDLNSVKIYFNGKTTTDVTVNYSVKDDRADEDKLGSGDSEVTVSDYIKAVNNPYAVYYEAKLYNDHNQIILTLDGGATFDKDTFDADFYSTMFRLDVTTSGTGTAALNNGKTLISTAVALAKSTVDNDSLIITFDQYLYSGETYMLYYTGQEVNYLGEESLTVNELYTDYDSSMAIIKNVPTSVDLTTAALKDYPSLTYKFTSGDVDKNAAEVGTSVDIVLDAVTAETTRRIYFKADATSNDDAEITNIKWSVGGETAQENDGNALGKFKEGSTEVVMTAVSKREIEGFDCVYDKASFFYNISKTITVNCYADTMTSSLNYYTDAACTTELAATTSVENATGTDKTFDISAGQVFYVVNTTNGGDLEAVLENSTVTTLLDGSGYVITDSTDASTAYGSMVTFSSVDTFSGIDVTVTREEKTDLFTGTTSDKQSLTDLCAITVADSALGFDWAYYTTTNIRLTLDNGVKFDTEKVPAADLSKFVDFFTLYYDGAGTDSTKSLGIKSLSYQSSNTILQITLNGGTVDKMYSDDKLYLVFDADAALAAGYVFYTTDSFNRTLPAIDEVYTNYLSSGANTEHLPFTNVLTDDSFDFSAGGKLATGDLNYYTSASKCPEGEWSFGNNTASYSIATVMADETGEKYIRLVPNLKSSATRALYNGSHLTMASGSTYYGSFEYYIPENAALTTSGETDESTGESLRPAITYYLGCETTFPTGATAGMVTLTSATVGEYGVSQGSWKEDYQVGTSNPTSNASATTKMPRPLVLNTYGTYAYRRIWLYANRFDLEFHVRNFRLEKVETRPL